MSPPPPAPAPTFYPLPHVELQSHQLCEVVRSAPVWLKCVCKQQRGPVHYGDFRAFSAAPDCKGDRTSLSETGRSLWKGTKAARRGQSSVYTCFTEDTALSLRRDMEGQERREERETEQVNEQRRGTEKAEIKSE